MDSESNTDLLLPIRVISSSTIFDSTSTTEYCISSLIDNLSETDNLIKLENDNFTYLSGIQSESASGISTTQLTPTSPIDEYETGNFIDIQKIFANRLPTQLKTPIPSSPSTSSSSLSLSLDINSGNFLVMNNYHGNDSNLINTENMNESNVYNTNNLESSKEQQNETDDIFDYYYSNDDYHSINGQQQQHQQQFYSQDLSNQECYNFSTCNNTNSNINFDVNQKNCFNSNSSSKQDVSVGTDLSICRDLRYKKDFEWLENYKLSKSDSFSTKSNTSLLSSNSNFRFNSYNSNTFISNSTSASMSNICNNTSKILAHESFKLIEKVQPKKSRTKYSKDQIEVLESAYWKNNYPDLSAVEQLCKSLGINKEKINIWFQNRRARSKRVNV